VTFQILNADQRSESWFAARCGRLTGSRAGDMLATIKSGEAAARRDYKLQLVCERLTGQPQEDGFVNAAMQRGIALEPAAFAAYEALTGQVVRRTGFLAADDLLVGCSLDGDVENFAGIVELKCPKSATHLRYLRDGGVPKEHLPQLRHNLWVSGAAWADFLSYDDRMPEGLQTFLARLEAKDADLENYNLKARAFLSDVEVELEAVKGLMR
jgi:predicted phage-related endonuclease